MSGVLSVILSIHLVSSEEVQEAIVSVIKVIVPIIKETKE